MDTRFLEIDKKISKEIEAEFGKGYLPPLPTVQITAPEAWPGQTASFANYRTKAKEGTWGKVIHVETHWRNANDYEYVYTVKPVNKSYTIRVRNICLVA